MKRPNAVRSRLAIVRAKAISVSATCCRASSTAREPGAVAQPARPASSRTDTAAKETLLMRVDLVKDAVVAEVLRLYLRPAAEVLDRHECCDLPELRRVFRGNRRIAW